MNAETLIVKRTCKFRLITPNTVAGAAQRAMFAQLTGASRVVWNAGVARLQDRRENPEKYEGTKPNLRAVMPELREEKSWFANLERSGCAHILDHPLRRLDTARKAAFGRLKKIQTRRAAGNKTRQQAGFPKFHAKREDESFTIPDGFKALRPDGKYDRFPVRVSESRKRILLPGVLNRLPRGAKKAPENGPVNPGWIRLNRKVPEGASVKCVVIKRDGQKWFAFLQCEMEIPVPSPHSGPAIGLDLNAEDRAQIAASDGRFFPDALGETESDDLAKSKARAETRRKRYERRMSRLRDIALRERGEWNGKNTARKSAEKRLKDSHMAEIESRRKHRVVVAGPCSVLPATLAEACEKAGLSAERLEAAGVLKLLADRKAPTRKFFVENIADAVPGISLPQWRRAKTALDELLPRNKRRQKFGESKYGVRYQVQRERKRKASARIKNIRDNFGHRVSARLARECGLIGVEKLQLQDMTASAKGTAENPGKNVRAKAGVNRSMLDKSFGGLRQKLEYKAEANGGRVEQTPYAYTSQACNRCGCVDPQNRQSTARFKCVGCGHEDDAQANAAKNVLALARFIAANPEAAKNIPPGPSTRTKKLLILALGDGAPRSATGADSARSGNEGARSAQVDGSSPPQLPRGKRREITPANARNRATKPKKESGISPDSPEKSRRCAGKGGTTP